MTCVVHPSAPESVVRVFTRALPNHRLLVLDVPKYADIRETSADIPETSTDIRGHAGNIRGVEWGASAPHQRPTPRSEASPALHQRHRENRGKEETSGSDIGRRVRGATDAPFYERTVVCCAEVDRGGLRECSSPPPTHCLTYVT